MNPIDLRLYGILDPARANGRDLASLALRAAGSGCTLLQYRDKEADTRRLVARAREIKAALRDTGVPVLVNDRVDVALAAGTDGVHLGQSDMHPADARRLLGPDAIIGLTVKTPAQADELFRFSVDYACVGGVFETASKDNPEPPIGLEGLARIAFRARLAAPGIPVGAIAGIDDSNAAHAIGAGADGVAVISAIFAADKIEEAARLLRTIVDRALAMRGASP